MPRSQKPSKIFPNTITEVKIPSDEDFNGLLEFFPKEKKKIVLKIFKEIFESKDKNSKLLKGQTHSSSPSSIKILLNDLKSALQPFSNPEHGVDEYTYNLINTYALKILKIIEERIEELDNFKMTGSLGPEHATYFASRLHIIFDKFAINKSKECRRNFLALGLDLAEFKYPDKDSSRTKFDKQFMNPIIIHYNMLSTYGSVSAKFGAFFVPTWPR